MPANFRRGKKKKSVFTPWQVEQLTSAKFLKDQAHLPLSKRVLELQRIFEMEKAPSRMALRNAYVSNGVKYSKVSPTIACREK